MNPADFAVLFLLNLAGVITPGPDVVLITRLATRSRKHAAAASLGTSLGALMWITLTVLGAAAVLTAFPRVLVLLQVIGGAWIVLMGVTMLRQGMRDRGQPPADLQDAVDRLGSVRAAFFTGLATNLSNPKIVLFLAALIAPLLPPSPSLGTALPVIVALWLPALLIFLLISVVVSTERVRRRLLGAGPSIDIGAGAFFIAAGSGLVIRGVTG
ncbi:LysE family translocator [Corynebacterium sp. CCUG 65737]|uniref:LysE family translocator n=1 Tax=unclassified Corynebacterium TaxID=2624378 RepID=UPI00210EAE1D|nr:LysE family translocator [Corynebacterium sp. CCUG 70398]MCQ4627786.1 LysE family translocator [Corynebacterium sp. CCUG 65737]